MGDSSDEETIHIENIVNENRLNKKKNINLSLMIKYGPILQKAISKIKIPGGYGTGFFCKIPYPNKQDSLNVLITNNHVLNEEFFEDEDIIELELDNETYKINLNKTRKIWTDKGIDYTIIEILKEDKFEAFLMTDDLIKKEDYTNKKYKNESIILPAIMENQEVELGGIGAILSAPKNGSYFLHSCNTDKGSSGGPILLVDNFNVVGIHKGYDKENDKNIGIFLYNILNDIKNKNCLKINNNDDNNKIIKDEYFIDDKDKEIVNNQLNNNICKIFINNKEIGIGFLCIIPYPDKLSPMPVIFIYSENIPKEDIITKKQINLKFNNNNKILPLNSIERKMFYYNDNNILILEIKKNENFNFNTFLEIDDSKFDNNEFIYLLSNNFKGNYKKHKIKRVDNNKYIIEDNNDNNYIFSPVLKLSNNKILGINIEKSNKFDFINNIIKEFKILEKKKENVIILTLEIDKSDINEKIYFLDNTDYIDTSAKHYHDNLKELNESNVKLFINDEEYKYKKYFIPKKEGIYTIKLIFNIQMKDCSYMFGFSNKLIDIDLSSFNTEKVTNMTGMFFFCSKLTNINLSSFNTQNVTNMSYMFSFCNKLTNINLPSFNTEKVKNMSDIFNSCSNLKNIDLSSFNITNVNVMSNMFLNCPQLLKIKVNSNSINKFKNQNNYCQHLIY